MKFIFEKESTFEARNFGITFHPNQPKQPAVIFQDNPAVVYSVTDDVPVLYNILYVSFTRVPV